MKHGTRNDGLKIDVAIVSLESPLRPRLAQVGLLEREHPFGDFYALHFSGKNRHHPIVFRCARRLDFLQVVERDSKSRIMHELLTQRFNGFP